MHPLTRLVLHMQHAELPASEEWVHQALEATGVVSCESTWLQLCKSYLLHVQGSVRLVAGNTGFGIYKEWLPEDHLIDVKQVPELRRLSLSKVLLPMTHQRLLFRRATRFVAVALPDKPSLIRLVAGRSCCGIY